MSSLVPLVRVRGTHREVGAQIGEACAAAIRRAADLSRGRMPRDGRSIDELHREASEYRRATEESFPWILEELDAAAASAGVDAETLFAASVEELWTVPRVAGAGRRTLGRCTDVVLSPPATHSGKVLVGHTNDLPATLEPDVVAVERRVSGEPTIFTLGIGPWISVGWNDAGLSLTGNEVSPNDERRGIPRLLMVRAQVRARTLPEAVGLATHPARASAYNTVFAHRDGGCVNVEASATASCCSGPDTVGAIVHTNHYVSGELAAFEGDPAYARRSQRRLDRASALVQNVPKEGFDVRHLHAVLSDHENRPDSICRHPSSPDDQKTVFWCVADVTAGEVTYGRGNPCNSAPQRYVFS